MKIAPIFLCRHAGTCWALACWLITAVACTAQTQQPQLLVGRYGMPAVIIGDSIAVIGGSGPDGFLNDIEKVDFATGKVTDIQTTLLPRRYHTAQAAGPYLYIMSGVTGRDTRAGLCPVVERYDTRTGRVVHLASMPTPRRMASSVLYQDKIYVIGGDGQRPGSTVGTVEIYDIKTNTWTEGTSMPTPRETAVAVRDGLIYAVAGYDGHAATRAFEMYDIAHDEWQRLPDLPFTMSAHHMAIAGDYLFTFGDYAQLGRVSSYNFATSRWKLLTGTGYQPSRHNAVVTAHDHVYVLGGNVAPAGSHLKSIQNSTVLALAIHDLEAAAARD